MGTPMSNPCPGDETVQKHFFCSKNWYIIQSDKKKVISCFCLILEYFKTLKYPNLYDYFIFLPKTEKIRPCPGDTGNRKFEQKSRKLKNQACFLTFSFSKKGWSTIPG
jgi:hypothetical protein